MNQNQLQVAHQSFTDIAIAYCHVRWVRGTNYRTTALH